MADTVTYCAWWALCTNPATTTRTHPILGEVPICDRCAAKLARLQRPHPSSPEVR